MPFRVRRSQIYVPGNNEKMITKASGFTSDSVIFDLEDAVLPSEKENARSILSKKLEELEFHCGEICVRINSLSEKESARDLDAVAHMDSVDTIVIPKAETSVDQVFRSSGKRVIPLIESPMGFMNLEEIARSEGVDAIAWAGGDLSLLAGGELSAYERNPYVLSRIVLTARAYGLEAIDKVYFDINNIEGLVDEAINAKNYGFSGKQVIHPTHVKPVEDVFSPSDEDVIWARKVVNAFNESGNEGRGALRLDDQLIDMVHVRRAEKVLQIVERVESKQKK